MPIIQENKILLYLIMIAGLILGFLYAGSADLSANVLQLEQRYRTAQLQGLRTARVDDSLVKSQIFQSLRIFGASVIESTQGSTTNLFE